MLLRPFSYNPITHAQEISRVHDCARIDNRPIRKLDSRGCFDRCSRPRSVRQWATVYNAISVAAPSTTGKLRTSS